MKFPLGAMSVGDVLDNGLKILFTRLPLLLGINVFVQLPIMVLQLSLPFAVRFQPDTSDALVNLVLTVLAALAVVTVLILILHPIALGATLRVVMQEFAGRSSNFREALAFSLRRTVPLIGTNLMVGLVICLGIVACLLPGIYFFMTYVFVAQVVVLEGKSGADAMSRGKWLVTGHRWGILGVHLLIGVASGIADAILGGVFAVLWPAIEVLPAEGGGFEIKIDQAAYSVQVVLSRMTSLVFTTYLAVCLTLMYLDLRIRKEGFDLELAAEQAEKELEQGSDPPRDDREYS